jgi:hypothetical protein
MKDGQTIGQWLNWDFEANGDLQIRDTNGKQLYFEDEGYWSKNQYDSKGNRVYYENSDGVIEDNRTFKATKSDTNIN